MGMSFIWFLILDFEDPWSKLILKAQIMYIREIYKNFPRKKQVIGTKKTMKIIIIYKLKCKNTFDNVHRKPSILATKEFYLFIFFNKVSSPQPWPWTCLPNFFHSSFAFISLVTK